MARKLTDREMRRVERWAQRSDLSAMLDFFQSLPDPIWIDRPVLLGVNNDHDIRIHGYMPHRRVVQAIQNLDVPYHSRAPFTRTIKMSKREERIPGSPFSALFRALRKGLPAVCMLQEQGGCRGEIVRSHSIQRARLAEHADENGQVYELNPLTRPQDDLRFRRVGTSRATTFLGFCSRHDNDLFARIETDEFEGSPEQVFLYHYRAFAHAYYGRAHKFTVLHALYDDLVAKTGPSELEYLRERFAINEADVRDLQPAKALYDQRAICGGSLDLQFLALGCYSVPPILCSEFFAPSRDLNATYLQDGKQLQNPLEWMSLTMVPTRHGGLILFVADRSNRIFNRFCESLLCLRPRERYSRIGHFAVCMLENLVILPNWWRSLSKTERRVFTDAARARYFPRRLPQITSIELNELHRG